MIYLDNAATSWPKPEVVYDAVSNSIKRSGNPGRSNSEEARAAATDIIEARTALAELFHVADPNRIVFALNATDAINLGLQGMLKPGDHVITSQMEHNAVTRPLAYLEDAGVMVTKVKTDPVSGADLDEVRQAFRPETKLVIMTHASNVTGTLNPIGEIGAICREHNVPFMVDASQSAGAIPIDVVKMNIDLLAFPGHKSLLGPTGTGALYVSETVSPKPVRSGGTGVFSEVRLQPEQLPYYYEAGTQNTIGIAGLCAGAHYILERSVNNIYFEEQKLVQMLIDGLTSIPGVTVYGPLTAPRAAAVSFNIEGMDCADVAMILESYYDISVRSGLQCAPDTHRMLGTIDIGGTVRVSPGLFTTADEIDEFLWAVREISEGE
ncbi:MAG: aminotransferase class V-fold PLP-dependent enzyme [Clostridiales bacterium]|nr:aminotransferase class V-fold PLP-dependent enzyme [Clostridiales bacterium]